ncbi:MAG: chemotaxis protein CheD [Acidobacteriia bacterium]|nr:chemotaxis protein CheD [Terriglobia bacterium]
MPRTGRLPLCRPLGIVERHPAHAALHQALGLQKREDQVTSLVVGISDCKVSKDADSVLITYALGSCIAVVMHDAAAGVSGLLHYMLPDASLDPAKAAANPCMFADTGIAELLRRVLALGANKKKLSVRIAGGAQVVSGHELFQIGRRNSLAARKLLWKEGLLLAGEAVGGEVSRTVRIEVATGRTAIREGGIDRTERN